MSVTLLADPTVTTAYGEADLALVSSDQPAAALSWTPVPTESLFPSTRFSVSERRAMLVGRASEMRELERAYALARDRRVARTVTVVGATGLGKTRLVRDFLVRSREGGQAPRVFRGSAREGGPA